MSLGKRVRLNRIFAHPSGRLCSVAVDHVAGYETGLPVGLRDLRCTLEALVAGAPDAVTMHKGVAASLWGPYAGKVPLIVQASFIRPDDTARQQVATPEDAVRLGADALAVAAFVRGDTEAEYLRTIADVVREAERFEMPVICHIYPRVMPDARAVSFAPEDIAWAVRCAFELGVDVVKTPYCGDVRAYAQIVRECPVPLVAAGGPKTAALVDALQVMTEVVASGARGATIGRNIWGGADITAAVHAFKAVLHDGASASEAMKIAEG